MEVKTEFTNANEHLTKERNEEKAIFRSSCEYVKRMRKNIILRLLVIVIAFFMVTCTSNNKKLVFEKEENASSIPVKNSPFLGLPIVLVHFENQLLISDFYLDSLITIFDLNENRVIAKLAKKGIGPNEALPPLTISIVNDSLLTFNKNKFQLGYYDLKTGSGIRGENHFLFQVTTQVSQIAHIHYGLYLASGFFEHEKRYALLNSEGKIENEFGDFPHFLDGEKDRPANAKAMFHQTRFETNRNVKKIACLSSHVLDIVDFSDDFYVSQRILLDTYNYKFSVGDVLFAEKTEDTSVGAIDVTSTDRYIYVLFNNSKNQVFKLNKELWIFDWAGTPIKKIKVDETIRLITAISDSLLYAIALMDEDYSIVKLNI
jgi:hypothetical protein